MSVHDRRVEVARKLRETYADRMARFVPQAEGFYEIGFVDDLRDCLPRTRGDDGLFDELADLIDPTCHFDYHRYDGPRSGQAAPWDEWECRCSSCWETVMGWNSYCPHCGARHVKAEDGPSPADWRTPDHEDVELIRSLGRFDDPTVVLHDDERTGRKRNV